jgi:hypothetical protein
MPIHARHRDKNGKISRKHGNTLIRTLRKHYGADFAKGCSDNEKLSDVLHKLDEPSLSQLISDQQIRRTPSGGLFGRSGVRLRLL